MKLAALPFNAAEGTSPALGRQLINFAADIVRSSAEGVDINSVSYLGQVDDNGQQRADFINVSSELLEPEWLGQMFQQSGVDRMIDGLLTMSGESISLVIRAHDAGMVEPTAVEEWNFTTADLFEYLRRLMHFVADQAEGTLPGDFDEKIEFGTDNPVAFAKFLEAYDALLKVQQANGRVVSSFTPEPAIEMLFEAVELDPDFEAPADVIVQLCRACANYRLGSFTMVSGALERLAAKFPQDFKPLFGLGEIYAGVGDHARAAEYYEKASQLDPEEPAIISRLGMEQLADGMRINAERNFRRALALEGPDKPSADPLAAVLAQTGRAHEIPGLWKSIIEEAPQNGLAHARYAMTLIQSQKVEEGERAFETALETLEDNLIIKRFYAPYLADKNDLDRAMDFYEDCLDHEPNDIECLIEYAKTLSKADRDFEVPRVLQQIMASNPDQNVRAQTLAWMIELEQPKRIESVQQATEKIEAGEHETALRELKPLRNWLADYWKLWALLASASNAVGEFAEAEEYGRKLIELFPGYEPGYAELANALGGQEKHEEAYMLMRFAANNHPQSLPMFLNLALAAKRAGHVDEAKTLAKQIREAVGANPELEPVLADIES